MSATNGSEPDRDIVDQWQYAVLTLQGDVVSSLNAAGKKGWELIQLEEQEVVPGQVIITALCKRRPTRIILASGLQQSILSRG